MADEHRRARWFRPSLFIASAVLLVKAASAQGVEERTPTRDEVAIIDATVTLVAVTTYCSNLRSEWGTIKDIARRFGMPDDYMNTSTGYYRTTVTQITSLRLAGFKISRAESCKVAFEKFGRDQDGFPVLVTRK